jgi:hypothetical protein
MRRFESATFYSRCIESVLENAGVKSGVRGLGERG